ncbi:Actin filament-coating protein tropomyosin [Handroanthus impetiginosus]|uniref:Actin filament-coating protein tropomyosin n=1 Tax=Handroanthus impetiginosus TaxID=429701 RepID=A0A2G9GLB4_9LAMI|nr:Actin filament-coating protein tropomyosin [Handroanthus impetiginosus]
MMRFWSKGSAGESPHTASPPTPLPAASSNMSAGPARPIRLVYTDEKGKFHMDPEAVALLQLVKDPVGVVSVCGRARQGKSFILNQLLGRSSGFQVASTHRPCTKGLWLWSAPLRRTALDGTEYNLLLLDSEGIDAYDQTGTYSTQIFSLAVLLSSMFIYNQMGGIDEAALDRLSLVTEMTKHIRVRASGGRSTASELGQFSPIFVWLLRDFYLDLVEDNRKITPRDYLELALRPVQGGGRDVSAKNEIRESIRALFPDRECFTLVRPLSNENDLQRLDQIALDKLRPEFRSGLDSLTRFVFERTRPKQMGATVMTGPILARITQSFLDALNNGAVPTITSSWQSVEEAECQRAFELASEAYMSAFDRSKPPEEAALREAHEDAVHKSMDTFNATAVGAGLARQKYEKRLQSFLRKAFEDIKKDAFREAYLQCTNTIENMEKELRIACHAPDAKIDTVLKVLDGLLSKYETTCHGPDKWRKAVSFLRQSLEGPLLDFIKRQIDLIGTEKTSLALKCRSIEDKMALLNKQLEASEKYKSEYMKRYEDATNDKKKIADDYMNRITNLQKKCSSLEEKSSNLSKTLDTARQESIDWKRKYELVLSKQKAEEEQTNAEIAMLRSKSSAAEARLAAAQEKAQSAQEEAEEWKRKYDVAVRETKNALEKAAAIQERTNYQTQSREAALRAEFSSTLAEKEEEIKEKATKIEQAEQRLTTLSLELKAAESKVKNYDQETSTLKLEIKELSEKVESANASALSAESKARILEQEKVHLEQKYRAQLNRFEEAQERCKAAEREAKRATELADEARAEAASAQKEKSDFQRVAMERLAQIERAERQAEALERQRADLANEVERYRAAEKDALFKVEMLEERVREREKEIDTLLQSNNSQRKNTVQVLETLLESERAAHAEASNRAEALSVQLQVTQGKLDELSQELTALRFNERTTLDSRLRTAHAKRGRTDDYEMGVDSVHDTGVNDKVTTRGNKRSKSTTSPMKFTSPEDGGSVFKGDEPTNSQQTNAEDYTKFTVQKLRQELTSHNFGAELLQLKNPNKKDILALYEKLVLKKS